MVGGVLLRECKTPPSTATRCPSTHLQLAGEVPKAGQFCCPSNLPGSLPVGVNTRAPLALASPGPPSGEDLRCQPWRATVQPSDPLSAAQILLPLLPAPPPTRAHGPPPLPPGHCMLDGFSATCPHAAQISLLQLPPSPGPLCHQMQSGLLLKYE